MVPICLYDFHTHLLPGIDDGSKSPEESLQMMNLLAEQGVKGVLLTPHFYANEESYEAFLARRNAAAKQLLTVWDPVRHPLLYLGAEVTYFEGIGTSAYIKQLCVRGTVCFLLEMPFDTWSESQYQDLSLLVHRGFTVVLAHVERYPDFRRRAVRDRLRAMGVLFQSNAEYFLARKTSRRARKLLRRKEIHLLGSDCHHIDVRVPNLGGAVSHLIKTAGDADVSRLFLLAAELLAPAVVLNEIKEDSQS